MFPRTRKAAIAIGVSAAPPLKFVAGAVNGARAFHTWARALGYDSRLVTDEHNQAVTVPRLRNALTELLTSDDAGIHRLLIYFAGHGAIIELEQGLWLLSDWSAELRAVDVEQLRRRLYRYRVDQIALFADACRTLPTDVDMADLAQDPVLPKGPGSRSATVKIDKFIAAQDGTRTFMIPGAGPDDDRCLFSGLLLEALWGIKESAFSTLVPGRVTSRSLASYLETEVPRLAEVYRASLEPTVVPTFPENDDVYFAHDPAVTPPTFPPWPPPETLLGFEPGDAERELQERRLRRTDTGLEDRLRTQRPRAFETGSGFAVDGEPVVKIWTAPDAAVDDVHPGWWRIRRQGMGVLTEPTPVLFEFASGVFGTAAALPDFVASVLATERGVSALVYRENWTEPEVAAATEAALGILEHDSLRATDAPNLAIELRQEKHADPVRGVLSAYLYDGMGDVESIRRMAFYYVEHAQAIPYDIALLAQLEGGGRDDGVLWTTVPAVPARDPRTLEEAAVKWTYEATGERTGVVAGFWPWLRQGWALLGETEPADDGSTLVLPAVIEVAKRVTPARFTTLDHDGAHALIAAFDLQPSLEGF